MKHTGRVIWLMSLVALIVLLSPTNRVNAQEPQDRPLFSKEEQEQARKAAPQAPARAILGCSGKIAQVIDVGYEGLKITSAVFGTTPGGGEGREFDKTPVLSTKVKLSRGVCLDAHLSAIVGSKQVYGVSRMALFQVTLTPANGGPRHMVGHYETPFGRPAPAVALEAERDVDMYASHFFQRVGDGQHEVPAGSYTVDVWWAGGPDPGGAIGAAFVLKLYLQ
jgi:hypothetical protein